MPKGPPIDEEAVIRDIRAGYPWTRLAQVYGVTRGRIERIAAARGIAPNPTGRPRGPGGRISSPIDEKGDRT